MTDARFVELLETAAHNLNINGEPRPYSGRCMYGKQCVSIEVHDDGDLMALGAAMMLECVEYDSDNARNHESLLDLLKGTRTDSMGRNIVAYWPKVQPPASLTDSDDEKAGDDA